MNHEQLDAQVQENEKVIAVIQESLKSFEHRLGATEKVVASIHSLASNVQALTIEVKGLTESVEQNQADTKVQVGEIKALLKEYQTETNNRFKAMGERVGTIEKKPAKRWEGIVDKVLLVLVGGIVAFFLARLGMGA